MQPIDPAGARRGIDRTHGGGTIAAAIGVSVVSDVGVVDHGDGEYLAIRRPCDLSV